VIWETETEDVVVCKAQVDVPYKLGDVGEMFRIYMVMWDRLYMVMWERCSVYIS
jgi:hypothetical protein